MKKAILVGMVGSLVCLGALVSAAEVKIGYVNLRQVKETQEWKRLEAVFQTEVNKSQIEVEQRKRELEKAALQYQRQKAMLSEETRREKERELQKRKIEFQLWAQERQQTLERKRDQMSQQIWSRVKEVVEKIARKKHLTLVIDYNPAPSKATENFEKGFVYLAPQTDITEEVIKELNTIFEGKT
ncbi:MAG: OmpH family outer membrane protein [Deltaproteobacteria bacterium]|nr:OmpH family outer membrane protein [Deltaproteobacteria bacterium]